MGDTDSSAGHNTHPKVVKRGHIWSFVSDEPLVFYEYTPNWQGAAIQELLKDYAGTLQGDGYAGLNPLYEKESGPKRAGCLAHARRKFVAAYQAGDLRVARTLQLIQELYGIERRANEDRCNVTERLRRRQEFSAPRMKLLRQELDSLGNQAPPKTPLGVAITYARRQWEALTLFLSDGAQRIDNNHTERSLRPIAVGRKNWLFAGSDQGARRLAILYTVVGSCELAESATGSTSATSPWRASAASAGHPLASTSLFPLTWHNTRTLRYAAPSSHASPLQRQMRWVGQLLDNNHTERSLRPIAVGRKNWLFAGSDHGARRLAILYTVVGSCELAGIRDPWEYVRDILQSLSRSWPHSRLDELLPLAWHNTRTLR